MPVLASILDGFGDTYSKYVLNFNGHSHDYERFVRIHGVTHVTGAGGGASLEVQGLTTDSRSAYRAMHLEHVRVDVTATAMHIDAVCGPATSRDDITCTEGSVIDSVTIPAPVPAPVSPPSTEFVGNPGFEVDTSGWNGVGSGVGLTRVAGGHSGDWAADVSKSDPTPSRCFLTDSPNWVAVSSSGTYTAGLWARADQSGSTLTLRLREYSNGVRVNIASQPVSLTTSWQEVSVALTPLAPGDSTIDLSAGLSDAPDGGCFYVDDVSLTLAP
jgi:hypothetical protein